MSKIGKKGIEMKEICKLKNKNLLLIKEKNRYINYKINKPFYYKIIKKKIFIKIKKKYRNINKYKSMWGTYRSILNNIIIGSVKNFKKVMKVEGVGYYIIEKKRGILEINSGYSHLIYLKMNNNIEYNIINNVITLECYDKSILGLTCMLIKKAFKKSSYKKKGIFFENERFHLKIKKKK
ncbi:hypothetical protein ACT2CC_00815 [Candidatus Vidania fulgoroideorum]